VAVLQHADAIVREEIAAAGLERELWQAFACSPTSARSA
jgi:GMP synthase PP-ATPase subunit